MKSYRSTYWQVDLPDDWVSEQEDDSVVLYQPDHGGSVVLSAVREEQEISDEYLADLVEDHIEAGAELEEVELGNFSGLSCCYEGEGEYWCEWYLRSDQTLLFVTYNCSLEEEGTQDDVVESILESLQVICEANLH